MGIGITSNYHLAAIVLREISVSIPNGDRHYLEPYGHIVNTDCNSVSIPNGDRHYLERKSRPR